MNKKISFKDYVAEASSSIVPPSGNTISPTSSQPQSTTSTQPIGSQVKSIWPGKGAPVEMGMTVGLTGPNGMPVPGTVSQVDMASKGVKVKNSTTGQDEWYNNADLKPFMAASNQATAQQQTPQNPQNTQQTELQRLRELSGISENCSGGATSAGSIAIAPGNFSQVQKRKYTNEEVPAKEYYPKGPPKTIVGDTKPNQATGELSANLAARNKKTASRTNNGFKR